MANQFKSMDQLVEYLSTLEQRIDLLEKENDLLRPSEAVGGNVISKYVARALPRTNLISPSFLKRSFAVWGHFFVAHLIMSVIFLIGYACLMMVMFGSMFGNLVQSQK